MKNDNSKKCLELIMSHKIDFIINEERLKLSIKTWINFYFYSKESDIYRYLSFSRSVRLMTQYFDIRYYFFNQVLLLVD